MFQSIKSNTDLAGALQSNINKIFMLTLAVDDLSENFDQSDENELDTLIKNAIVEINWIADEFDSIIPSVHVLLREYRDHSRAHILNESVRVIPRQVEKLQNSVVSANLQQINGSDINLEITKAVVYLHQLQNSMSKTYQTLHDLK